VAATFRNKAVAVLMTGMGEDGAAGMGAIQAAGGVTLAQSPDTCIVDSMPRSAISRGFVSRVVSLSALAGTLQAKCIPDRPQAEPAAVPSGVAAGDTGSRRRSS
jgi:two-component system, chemotaxis family, protein-glutamate methylesterase/glutaminase